MDYSENRYLYVSVFVILVVINWAEHLLHLCLYKHCGITCRKGTEIKRTQKHLKLDTGRPQTHHLNPLFFIARRRLVNLRQIVNY